MAEKSKAASIFELIKPRLTAMALFSGAVGFVAGTYQHQMPKWLLFFYTVIGLAFVGAASNITNQAMEVELDRQMKRTEGRPIVTNRVTKSEAYLVAGICLIIGYALLFFAVQPLVAHLALATYLSYVVIYTPMKTKSFLNTIVGAFPGALPTFTGFVAARGEADYAAFTVFTFLFIWQLPHFFSIAWIYKEDYQRAGYKMMSLYDETGKQAVALILVGNLALIASSYLPMYYMEPKSSVFYALLTTVGNVFMFILTLMLVKNREKHMKAYFYASIIYLPYILILLMFFRGLPLNHV